MIREAIVLAGGLGTRLKETVPGLPKCMAPVAGRPFLFYVIRYLRQQGVEKIIFSLGYKHETIEEYLLERFPTLDHSCVIESEPLGTGGAIQLALSQTNDDHTCIVNGDTFFDADLRGMNAFHRGTHAVCTLALKPMENFERYGMVETDAHGRVIRFLEKKHYTRGNINGGIYILHKQKFSDHPFPEKFSFEKDYLEKYYPVENFSGFIQDEYFMDIGIPEDYLQAQADFASSLPDLKKTGKDWTLFIDRDGIINHEKKDGYILDWDEFNFYEDAKEAFRKFNETFGKIIVVSNQRGVGRGLMKEQDLARIHANMKKEIEASGGRIDHIYYCTSTDNKDPLRKPNPGMAFKAKEELPGVDLSRSIMVGNKMSDMLFGKNAGMHTVFIATTNGDTPYPHPEIDFRFDSLSEFVKVL
jgi:D-glycero-alpha-D-manno-heptose 1-phosphate guanylyltransferase